VRFPEPGVQLADLPVHTGQNFNGLNIWHWDWGGIPVNDEATEDGQAVAWSADFLSKSHKQPFFLTVGLYRPHSPWYVPQSYLEAFPEDQIQLPRVKEDDLNDLPAAATGHVKKPGHHHELIVSKGLWKSAVRAYLASIAFADAQVGKLLAALDGGPHAQNTIVCLTSDHGWYLGEKQMWHKGKLWEETTRVPLTLAVPGVTTPETVCTQPVSLLDVYPTLTDLAKLKAPDHLDGESLLPLLKAPDSKRTRPALTASGGGESVSYAVRTERWRYIRYADGGEELYDHDADPDEWQNLAAAPEHAAVKAELAATLPTEFANASRPVSEIKLPEAADASVTFALQPGDVLSGTDAPQLVGHGLDLDLRFDFKASVDQDSGLVSQGDSTNGWALHMLASKPTLSLFINGERKDYSLGALKDGLVTLRAQVSGGGRIGLSVNGHGELFDQTPFPAGFPTQPVGALRVGESFGPLKVADFPNSTPFDGTMQHLWLTVLPVTQN
jgi:hypothetical protein